MKTNQNGKASRDNKTSDPRFVNIQDLAETPEATNTKPLSWHFTAIQCAKIVGRIWKNKTGQATGFLLSDASLLHPKWSGLQVFLTNSHVISDTPAEYGTLKPQQAEITFDALSGDGGELPRFRGEIIWESPSQELDTSILVLDREVPDIPEVPVVTEALPGLYSTDETKSQIHIIGHPKGKKLSISILDNQLLAFNERFIHYLSPTTYGSSGSPVFNENWELLGMHHKGSHKLKRMDLPEETYAANEGILISAIISTLMII